MFWLGMLAGGVLVALLGYAGACWFMGEIKDSIF